MKFVALLIASLAVQNAASMPAMQHDRTCRARPVVARDALSEPTEMLVRRAAPAGEVAKAGGRVFHVSSNAAITALAASAASAIGAGSVMGYRAGRGADEKHRDGPHKHREALKGDPVSMRDQRELEDDSQMVKRRLVSEMEAFGKTAEGAVKAATPAFTWTKGRLLAGLGASAATGFGAGFGTNELVRNARIAKAKRQRKMDSSLGEEPSRRESDGTTEGAMVKRGTSTEGLQGARKAVTGFLQSNGGKATIATGALLGTGALSYNLGRAQERRRPVLAKDEMMDESIAKRDPGVSGGIVSESGHVLLAEPEVVGQTANKFGRHAYTKIAGKTAASLAASGIGYGIGHHRGKGSNDDAGRQERPSDLVKRDVHGDVVSKGLMGLGAVGLAAGGFAAGHQVGNLKGQVKQIKDSRHSGSGGSSGYLYRKRSMDDDESDMLAERSPSVAANLLMGTGAATLLGGAGLAGYGTGHAIGQSSRHRKANANRAAAAQSGVRFRMADDQPDGEFGRDMRKRSLLSDNLDTALMEEEERNVTDDASMTLLARDPLTKTTIGTAGAVGGGLVGYKLGRSR